MVVCVIVLRRFPFVCVAQEEAIDGRLCCAGFLGKSY